MREPAWIVETSRLGLRAWTPDDLPLALRLWGDPAVTRLIDARPRLDEAAVQQRLQRELDSGASSGVQYWAAFRLSDGEFVGCCGLRPRGAGVLELGFHLCSAHWGRGYASEAARAVVTHAFLVRGAGALFAGHHPENEGSRRVLLALGFRHTHDELYPPTGCVHPCYRLEREAWRSAAAE